MYSLSTIVEYKIREVNTMRKFILNDFHEKKLDDKFSKEEIETELSELFDEIIDILNKKESMLSVVLKNIKDIGMKEYLYESNFMFITQFDIELHIKNDYNNADWMDIYEVLQTSFKLFYSSCK